MNNQLNRKILILASVYFLCALATLAPAQSLDMATAARMMKTASEQMSAGDYKGARDSFEQLLQRNDSSSDLHLGLGIAYFHLHEDKLAERELLRVIELAPDNPVAYQVLGNLFYRKDELDTAILWWTKALELNPADTKLRTHVERIRREQSAEKDFSRDVTSHFLIKYEGREKIETGRIILRVLEDAYGEVGRALSYYPEREIQVILYTGKQFQEVTGAPGWSGAIFDGKIRIPIGGLEQETPALRKLLYHEYTHAVVRAITPHCPTWLNEGLAQYFEGREIGAHQREFLKRMAKSGSVPALSSLEGSFMGLGSGLAENAYVFSLSAVRYIVDDFRLYRIKMILDELASGADTGNAISNSLMVPYEELERAWRKTLE